MVVEGEQMTVAVNGKVTAAGFTGTTNLVGKAEVLPQSGWSRCARPENKEARNLAVVRS